MLVSLAAKEETVGLPNWYYVVTVQVEHVTPLSASAPFAHESFRDAVQLKGKKRSITVATEQGIHM